MYYLLTLEDTYLIRKGTLNGNKLRTLLESFGSPELELRLVDDAAGELWLPVMIILCPTTERVFDVSP